MLDLSGRRFGRLLVLSFSHRRESKIYFKCICDCGKEHTTTSQCLKNGESVSCGCYKNDFHRARKTIHGMYNKRIYRIWQSMVDRCTKPNNDNYPFYGGRGISVCERWMRFENFYEDTKKGYSDDLTLDRFPNNDGNYEPENFRWATKMQQSRNTRAVVYIEHDGKKLPRSEWAEKLGGGPTLIKKRLKLGWSIKDAVTTPVITKYQNKCH